MKIMGAEFRGDLIRNVKLYEFQNMYPRIMVLLHDEEIYKIPKYIDRLRNFLDKEEILKNQLSEEDYISERTWIRSIYGILVRNREIVPGLISKYLDLIYGDIISDENKKKIIYIDTDWIFTTEEINIDVPLPIESYDIPAFYIEDKRKYIFYNGIKISHKGLSDEEKEALTDPNRYQFRYGAYGESKGTLDYDSLLKYIKNSYNPAGAGSDTFSGYKGVFYKTQQFSVVIWFHPIEVTRSS
jgi:hypothetical protein